MRISMQNLYFHPHFNLPIRWWLHDPGLPVRRDEISTRSAGAYFTLRLHVEIKFHHGKAGQFSTCYLFRFAGTFLEFFL